MEVETLTDEAYWKNESGEFKPFLVSPPEFHRILERYLPVSTKMTCIEIGAYPGGNLCYLHQKFSYRTAALEFRSDADDIVDLFKFNDAPPPEIIRKNFLQFGERYFDVVTSFGFVEHFANTSEIIKKHVEITADQGYVVISVPHFWGMQGLFRRAVFSKEAYRELKSTHHLPSMHLPVIKSILQTCGLNILYARHVMRGSFWVPPNSPKIDPRRRWLAKLLSGFNQIIGRHLPSCALFSPMMLFICQKNEISHDQSTTKSA